MKFTLTNEAKIGIMVAAVVTALGLLTVKTGDFKFRPQGYELKAYFYNIDGVDKNAPVRLNGMEVGLVKDMKILYGEDTKMELTLWMNEDKKVHEGSKAYVKNMGLFGEKYVGLTIGDSSKGYLAPGSIIMGEEPADFERIMADGQTIATNLKVISKEIRDHLELNREGIDELLANLRVTSKHIASITSNVDERLAVNKHLIDDIVSNINSATRNFDEMSQDLKLNPWKLMYKEKTKKPSQEKISSDATDQSNTTK